MISSILLSVPKIKSSFSKFALTKKSKIQFDVFFIRDLHISGGVIYYFDPWPFLQAKKMKNVKYRFWLQRGIKSHIRHSFLWATRMLWVGFICYFWLMTILSSQKLETVKYRFWLQKGVKNHIRYVFLIRDPEIMRGSIYYFWLIMILSSQKVKNVKYRFWLQKGIKNWIL